MPCITTFWSMMDSIYNSRPIGLKWSWFSCKKWKNIVQEDFFLTGAVSAVLGNIFPFTHTTSILSAQITSQPVTDLFKHRGACPLSATYSESATTLPGCLKGYQELFWELLSQIFSHKSWFKPRLSMVYNFFVCEETDCGMSLQSLIVLSHFTAPFVFTWKPMWVYFVETGEYFQISELG